MKVKNVEDWAQPAAERFVFWRWSFYYPKCPWTQHWKMSCTLSVAIFMLRRDKYNNSALLWRLTPLVLFCAADFAQMKKKKCYLIKFYLLTYIHNINYLFNPNNRNTSLFNVFFAFCNVKLKFFWKKLLKNNINTLKNLPHLVVLRRSWIYALSIY